MDIALGMHVTTSDGQDVGTIDGLAIDPATNRASAAVVRKGLLLHRDIQIPLDQLLALPPGSVQLHATSAEVGALPHFVEVPYTLPPVDAVVPAEGPIGDASWPELADDLGLTDAVEPGQRAWERNVIGRGAQVVAADGAVLGQVERLALDVTTRRLTQVVIKRGRLPSEEVELAVARIDRILDGVLFLA